MQAAVVAFYKALGPKMTPKLLSEALHSDWIIHPALPGAATDIEKYLAAVQPIFTAFPDFAINIDDFVANGEKIAVRGHVTATHKDTLFGAAPTGKRIQYLTCDFHILRDGKIAESWHLEDWFSVLQQVGALGG